MYLPINRLWRDARLAAQRYTADGRQLSINLTRCGGCRREKVQGIRLLRVHREPRRVLLYFLCTRCASFAFAQDKSFGFAQDKPYGGARAKGGR
jgi:hypothetical protein